ncbi:hypothetical protein [Pedobacter sp. NJ-S-72]
MKKINKRFPIKVLVVAILLVGTTLSCSGQKHQLNTNINSKNMQLPKVSDDFEKLDLNKLKAKANKSHGIKVLADRKTVEIEVYDYQFLAENGDNIRFSGDNYGEYRLEQRINGAYFNLIKIYNQNGNIKTKGLEFNVFYGTFKKGTWYGFSPEGKLTSTINYDTPFKFTFEQLVQFLEEEKIPLKKGPIAQNPGYLTSIKRTISDNQSLGLGS